MMTTPTDQVLDHTIVDELMTLSREVQPTLFSDLVKDFKVNSAKQIEGLRAQITQGNHQQCEQIAHSLKGSCGALGAFVAQKACALIEEKARSVSALVLEDLDALAVQVQSAIVALELVILEPQAA